METSSENLKRRNVMTEEEEEALLERLYGSREYDEDEDSDDELPYGGKVYLARKSKPDGWACIAVQVGFTSLFTTSTAVNFTF